MNNELWNKIYNHTKNKFHNNEKTKNINELSEDQIENMPDNVIYKTNLTCIAIDIIDSKKISELIGFEIWSKILSEFCYGISQILKNNNSWYIRIQGDSIYGLFRAKTKNDISIALRAAIEIKQFKKLLNKMITKYMGGIRLNVDYGIGIWFSTDNYVSKVGKKGDRDVVFIGDSVNYANALSEISNRKKQNFNQNNKGILVNELFIQNLESEDFNIIRNYLNISDKINNEIVYSFDVFYTNIDNWIENNT